MFCLGVKENKIVVNSASVQNVCAGTVLTDSSNNMQQLQDNNTEKFRSHLVLCSCMGNGRSE